MRRMLGALVIAVGLIVLAASPASAGGWSAVTVDDRPGVVNAEQEFTTSFTVRQHGMTPMVGLDPIVTFTHETSGNQVIAQATATSVEGEYVFTTALPEDGTWTWTINAFGMHVMAPFDVQDSEATGLSTASLGIGGEPVAAMFLTVGALSAIAAVAMVMAPRWRERWVYSRSTRSRSTGM